MRFPRLVIVSISLCAGIVLGGCGSTNTSNTTTPTPASGTPPSIVAVGMQATGVAPNGWQYVQFSEAMNGSTINAKTFVVTDASGKAAPGNVVYYPNLNVAGFQPNPALQDNATYTLTINTGAESTQGVPLAKPYTYNFTTSGSSDTAPLAVKSVTPAANATCVSASTPITITFSQGVDVSTLTTSNLVITGPGGATISATMTYDISSAVATITPASALPSGNITITFKNLAGAAGVAMAAPYSWTFDTSCTSGSSSAAAYVYISNSPSGNNQDQVTAYAADASGQLTPVPGSPFNQNVGSLAANGTYLMGSANSQADINTYSIGSDGSLTLSSQFDYTAALSYSNSNGTVCSAVGGLLFDRSGSSLYGGVNNIACSNNNAIASFAVDSANGSVSYLGNVNIGYESSSQIQFLSNDAFAYSALNDNCMYGGIFSFARAANGNLSAVASIDSPTAGPAAPPGATSDGVSQPGYRAGLSATDNSNHVIMVEYPCFALNGTPQTNPQLAVYTTDASGNLTTTDTYATMPTTTIQTPLDMMASPSGTFLAVSGDVGLQVFQLNGGSPITGLTGVLTSDSIQQIAWDTNNHLYAITSANYTTAPVTNPSKLYVFTVTSTGATQAPGSPYTIAWPASIAVKSN